MKAWFGEGLLSRDFKNGHGGNGATRLGKIIFLREDKVVLLDEEEKIDLDLNVDVDDGVLLLLVGQRTCQPQQPQLQQQQQQ